MYMYVCMYDCPPSPPPPCVGVWIRHCINEGGIGIQDNRVVCGYGNVNGQVIKCKSVLCGLPLHVLHMLLSSSTYCILPSPGNNTILNFLSVVFFRNVHFQIIPVR